MNKAQKKQNTHKPQFDLKTHVRDKKGNISEENHYRLTIDGGVKKFERPPGSGWFYDEAGTLIGKPKGTAVGNVKESEEFSNDSIQKQIASLQAKLALNKEKVETHQTAQDITVDDVPAIPVSEVDNSEEIQLMKEAGAMQDAQKLEQVAKKPIFVKPTFMK